MDTESAHFRPLVGDLCVKGLDLALGALNAAAGCFHPCRELSVMLGDLLDGALKVLESAVTASLERFKCLLGMLVPCGMGDLLLNLLRHLLNALLHRAGRRVLGKDALRPWIHLAGHPRILFARLRWIGGWLRRFAL